MTSMSSWAAGAALLATCAAPVMAQPPGAIVFSIPAGSLDAALATLIRQSGLQLLYTPDLVAGRSSIGLSGAYSPRHALERLLAGSGLEVREPQPGVLVLRRQPGPVSGADPAFPGPQALDEVVVTGTNIRGGARGPSPLLSFSRDQLLSQGHATVADALAALPQNFAATASPETIGTGADPTGVNASRATGVNLRGLGSDATLVLVNGRRMAGSGVRGDFADISAIPNAAIARVEVLLDGASAVYGSDAVGGVVNIILKDDFDGAETRLMLGAAAGGYEDLQASQTFGRAWTGGHVLAAYEYQDRSALPFAKRDFAASSDLRSFGGQDRRSTFASPGNVLAPNPATGALVPTWAIPAGRSQFPLRPQDFIAGEVNYGESRAGMDLLPAQQRHSLYAGFSQALAGGVELNGDVRFSRRTFESLTQAPLSTITVTAANPYFSSPNGSSSHQITYSFINDLGPVSSDGSAQSLGASLGADIALPGDWRAEAYLAYAQEVTRTQTTGMLNSLFLREALGAVPDNPSTPFQARRDGYFNPFADGSATPAAVASFIGQGYSTARYLSEVATASFKADGRLWTLPGGDLRLALGAQARTEGFDQLTVNRISTVDPVVNRRPSYERSLVAGFAELRAPLVGPDNQVAGIQTLELSLAGRIEHYDDVGTTADPKVGVVWAPIEDLRLRATYGTSFRAPALSEVFTAQTSNATFITRGVERVLALSLNGGNPGLRPETATSWTAGFDLTPSALPGLSLSATWFRTRFDKQIDRPVLLNLATALTNPAFAPFVRTLDPSRPADLAVIEQFLADPDYASPGLYPPEAFGAIVDNRYVNTASLEVEGLDMSARYSFDLGAHGFDLTASASYLHDYSQQLTPTSPAQNIVDTPGRPLALRTRATLAWRHAAWGGSLAFNYADDYRSDTGAKIDGLVTTDIQLRWEGGHGALKGLAATASAQNLFDAAPPFYDNPAGLGYDPANADALGRYVSLQLSKRW
jgi:iron complex outermembrane receptor protein